MRSLLIPILLTGCWHEPAQQTTPPPPQKRVVKDLVQPVYMEKQVADGEEGGEEGGVAGDPYGGYGDPCGQVGGVVGGSVGSAPPPPPPPPPPPMPVQNVPPTLLEGQRIAGNKAIEPDDVTKTEITRSGKDKIVGSFKLCVSTGGDVSSVSQLKSTGFAGYDSKLQYEMRKWRYRPYQVNGRTVPVCTAVTFIYSQAPFVPPPSPPPARP